VAPDVKMTEYSDRLVVGCVCWDKLSMICCSIEANSVEAKSVEAVPSLFPFLLYQPGVEEADDRLAHLLDPPLCPERRGVLAVRVAVQVRLEVLGHRVDL
jgi:hypothetical protein